MPRVGILPLKRGQPFWQHACRSLSNVFGGFQHIPFISTIHLNGPPRFPWTLSAMLRVNATCQIFAQSKIRSQKQAKIIFSKVHNTIILIGLTTNIGAYVSPIKCVRKKHPTLGITPGERAENRRDVLEGGQLER